MPYIADGKHIAPEGALILTAEDRERYKQKREKQIIYNAEVKQNSKKRGGFTFLKMENALENLNPATVGRLAYLSTFLDFGNQLLMRSKDRPMLKNDLPDVLQINRNSANDFFNECDNARLIEDHGKDGLYLNEVFFRHEAKKDEEQIRLYRNTIQQLYKSTMPKFHKYFGYVVQLVKHINREWNVVCWNPEETDSNKVEIMTLKELCEEIKYKYNHIEKLNEALLGLAFQFDGRKQALCASVEVTTEEGRQKGLIVNPNLIFAGTDFTKVEGYGMFFRPRRSKTVMQNDKMQAVKSL